MQEYIPKDDFLHTLEKYPGLLPVSIRLENKRVTWLDMGKYHFYEGFFHKSIQTFTALNKTTPITFSTDIDVLENDTVPGEYIYPTGFIFHAGRCGSTLLAKALARTQQNLVISEAEPLNQIWRVFTKNGSLPLEMNEQNKTIYRNLLLSLTRRRLESHQQSFIKFSSYNINFVQFIHSVFPDVPKIFITRNKEQIIQSFERKTSEWLKPDNPDILKLYTGYEQPLLSPIIDKFFQSAAGQPPGIIKQVDYTELTAENLPQILNLFNYKPGEKELILMKSQFSYDSKTEFNKKKFIG